MKHQLIHAAKKRHQAWWMLQGSTDSDEQSLINSSNRIAVSNDNINVLTHTHDGCNPNRLHQDANQPNRTRAHDGNNCNTPRKAPRHQWG